MSDQHPPGGPWNAPPGNPQMQGWGARPTAPSAAPGWGPPQPQPQVVPPGWGPPPQATPAVSSSRGPLPGHAPLANPHGPLPGNAPVQGWGPAQPPPAFGGSPAGWPSSPNTASPPWGPAAAPPTAGSASASKGFYGDRNGEHLT